MTGLNEHFLSVLRPSWVEVPLHNPSRRLRKELHPSTTPYFNTLTDTPVACRCHNINDIFLVVNDFAALAQTKTPEPQGAGCVYAETSYSLFLCKGKACDTASSVVRFRCCCRKFILASCQVLESHISSSRACYSFFILGTSRIDEGDIACI